MKYSLTIAFATILILLSFLNLFSEEKPDIEMFEGKLKSMGGEWFIISDGDFFQLNLAPDAFLKENNITFTAKQLLKVEGLIVDEVIDVYLVHINNVIIKLRDNVGNPLWQEEKQIGHYFIIPNKCIGCQLCVSVCPTEAISMIHGRAVIDADKCIDCGICENGNSDYNGCPTNAIKKLE